VFETVEHHRACPRRLLGDRRSEVKEEGSLCRIRSM
jgi:hypothetical protein